MQMDDLRRIRLFLDLRQVDVEKATAISVPRLSKSESGRITLTRAERIRLENFLRDRMRVVAEINRTRTPEKIRG